MNGMKQGAAPISGSWTHSFEEDEPGGVRVYRPTQSFAFPPTRAGRDRIVIDEGGELREQAPGPDDRTRDKPGRWRALGMNRFGLGGTAEQPDQVIEILEADPNVLKIRRW
jgi:hypothetical protein